MPSSRQNAILDQIFNNGNVSIDELAQMFDVSSMTIRRDINELLCQNYLQKDGKTYIINKPVLNEVSFKYKLNQNKDVKRKIAKEAKKLINENIQCIFLDAGSTTYELALQLLDLDALTILTNDLNIAALLTASEHNLVMLGGTIEKDTASTYGISTLEMLSKYNVDLAFIAAAGISQGNIVGSSNEAKAAMKRNLLNKTSINVLLADESKKGIKLAYNIANVDEFDEVIIY